MDLTNLKNNHQKLIQHLEDNGYSSNYIKKIKASIAWILKNDNEDWTSYREVLEARIASCPGKSVHQELRAIVNAIYRFDQLEIYPCGNCNADVKLLSSNDSLHKLNSGYLSLIEQFKAVAKKRGLKSSNVHAMGINCASFLLCMQDKGKTSLDMISEDDLLDYTLTGNKGGRFSSSKLHIVRNLFETLKKEPECARLAVLVPQVKWKRKNQPVLSDEEVAKIRQVLESEDSRLSLRDRAIVFMLLRLWMRCGDVANLRFSDIDWERERITLCTQKTGVVFDAVVPVEVLNAIYRYIAEERPQCNEEEFVFVTKDLHKRHIKKCVVINTVNYVFSAIGIRQEQGANRGTHMFRRYGATTALREGIPRPMISGALAHSSPSSITPYLRADFAHLKECALSIESFPVAKGVFHE